MNHKRDNSNFFKLEDINLFLNAIKDLGILAVDESGKIIFYNKASAENDGMNQEDVLGKPFFSIYDNINSSPIMETLSSGREHLDAECTYNTYFNTSNRSFGNSYPVRKNDRIIGAITIVRFDGGFKRLLTNTMALQKELCETRTRKTNNTHYVLEDLIHSGEVMNNVVLLAARAARSHAPVMIFGESGTGKELVAQGIHNASANNNEPYVAVNCSAIPENLLESTLFGTTKGAYTGAVDTKGLFVQAGKGTLLLDELNSMPLNLQAKLLRALQERAVRALGADKETPIECRIITSLNRHPIDCVREEILRSDLYYRLSVICIEVPPLRRRREDIALLVEYYLKMYSRIYTAGKLRLSVDSMRILIEHEWPGNVRELQHVIESAIVQAAPEEEIRPKHLQNYLRVRDSEVLLADQDTHLKEKCEAAQEGSDLHAMLLRYEKQKLLEALKNCGWNISKAARLVGYTRSNLQYRMRKLGITCESQ